MVAIGNQQCQLETPSPARAVASILTRSFQLSSRHSRLRGNPAPVVCSPQYRADLSLETLQLGPQAIAPAMPSGSFDYCGRVSSTVRPEPVEGPPRMALQAHHEPTQGVAADNRKTLPCPQGLSIILVESLPPFALSLSKGRPEWFSKLTTNGLDELPPTNERPWPCPGL